MARPLGKYQYYPQVVVAEPKPREDRPKRDDDRDDDEHESGAPAKMPTRADRVSPPKAK